jgi:hypothetical protein
MPRSLLLAAVLAPALAASPAAAQEVFAGAYVHGVETPFTLRTEEGGADFQAGLRFAPLESLAFIGKPAPYIAATVNTRGDTSFAGGGLGWKLGRGPVYVRPGLGIVVHDGPSERYSVRDGKRTDLGSRVLFAPEIAVGAQLSDRLSMEASWYHISHARLFNWGQNPGIDMMGVRLNLALD